MQVPDIRNRLRELRKQAEMTQEQLAEALGISRQTVIAIERGRYTPLLPLAFQIAGFFQLTIEEIFYADDEPTPEPARADGRRA